VGFFLPDNSTMNAVHFLTYLVLAAAPRPDSHLKVEPCEVIGARYQFAKVDCSIELRNLGDKPITVSAGEAKFSWDRIAAEKVVVAPHSTSYLQTQVDLRNEQGPTRHVFRFKTDEPGQPIRGSEVRAMVLNVLDQNKPLLDFGVVRPSQGKLPELSISLSSREVKDFQIVGLLSKPAWLDVTIDKDGHTVHGRVLPNVPWGFVHDEFIKVKINAPQQPEAWINVSAQVIGDVASDGNPFQLGLLRTNAEHDIQIRLTSPTNKEFELGKLDVERIKGTASAANCAPASKTCKIVHLKVSNDQGAGKLDGVLKVELPGYERALSIELTGMLLSPDTPVHKMEDLLEQSAKGGESRSTSPSSIQLSTALKSSVRKEDPPPSGNGPLLKWAVAHQGTTYGYVIYRAEAESGPFLRINGEIIPVVEQGEDKSGNYQWRDNSAESGKTYWYSIGIISSGGNRQDLSGPQRVVAK
jgi:hypothetical protein